MLNLNSTKECTPTQLKGETYYNYGRLVLTIYLLIFSIQIVLCENDAKGYNWGDTIGGTLTDAPTRYSGGDTIGNTLTEPSQQQSRIDSTKSFYINSQGSAITIEKNIKGLTEKYYKNENITIGLKVLNSNPRNRLEDIYIIEEIPDEFELINVKPDNYIELNKSGNPRIIKWGFKNNITKIKNLEYTVSTNKSGKYIFGSTILDAEITDKNGKKYEILQSSENSNVITIYNREPRLVKVDGLSSFTQCKSNKDIIINLSIFDPDYDLINAYIYKNDGNLAAKSNKNSTYNFNENLELNCTLISLLLNTSKYKEDLAIHRFTIEVTDGEDSDSEEYEIDIYNHVPNGWWPSIDTKWSILLSVVFAILGFISGFFYEKKLK